ncbi:hypothetical protein D1B33_01380 [Lysinibacillus yapensis]|uniref:ATP-grasp domain-containing protein n=1 Tax=Ureibacillus yapensis TaxID=2304605 RepID=A0A396SE12_9BACL|nr:ATP-grasp fold amidoligase family protein [Lysinibacillus yapensis]RHW39525.1 hypothetical protein D1B33_01380 [Lysinibacillus yapensis]
MQRGLLKGFQLAKWIYKMSFPILAKLSPKLSSKLLFYKTFGKKLDLKNPKTFNEKLMWLKLNENDELKTKCTDKFLVRKYISKLGYGHLLIDLCNVYENIEDIIFEELPEKFVMKCTHGSGFNIICKNKSGLDQSKTISLLSKWMKTDFSLLNAEPHYSKIQRRILVEKFLEGNEGQLPIDYKLHCFHGEAKFIELIVDRETGLKSIMLNCDWQVLPYTEHSIKLEEKLKKPEKFEEMIAIAEELSKAFSYVRVDLYYTDKIYFGELTFTPSACLETVISEEADYQIGQLLDLSKSTLL